MLILCQASSESKDSWNYFTNGAVKYASVSVFHAKHSKVVVTGDRTGLLETVSSLVLALDDCRLLY